MSQTGKGLEGDCVREREKFVPVIEINESLETAVSLRTVTLLLSLGSGVVCVSLTDWY